MNKVTALSIPEDNNHIPAQYFTPKQQEILKNSICKGVTDDQFQVFLMACAKTGLDPFMRQIYAIPRLDKKTGETNITIQTGIDGYRLMADRTGRYSPGSDPTYTFDEKGKLKSATAYIKKQTHDGTWHDVSASADYDEFCQKFTDYKTKETKPMGLWGNMPKTMLAKCAEAIAIRKAFPGETSGIYTREEMLQAEAMDITPEPVQNVAAKAPPQITNQNTPEKKDEKVKDIIPEIVRIFPMCSVEFQNTVKNWLFDNYGSTEWSALPESKSWEVYHKVYKEYNRFQGLTIQGDSHGS